MMAVRNGYLIVVALVFGLLSGAADAEPLTSTIDPATVPEKKRVQTQLYLTPHDVHQAMSTRSDIVFIDVRDPAEFQFVGFPTSVSKNIPFLLTDKTFAYDADRHQYKMVPNNNFVAEVGDFLEQRGLGRATNIIVQCRSGSRSAKAANALAEKGYIHVWQQAEGMEGDKDKSTGHRTLNGWKNAGLPWTYALTREIAHLPEGASVPKE